MKRAAWLLFAGLSCAPPPAPSAPPPGVDASSWELDRACIERDLATCLEAGRRYEERPLDAVTRRRVAAVYYRACLRGRTEGCRRLARLLAHGAVPAPDPGRLGALLRHVCGREDPGDVAGCLAAALLGRACDASDATACGELARLIAEGRVAGRPPGEAVALHDRACRGGERASCHELARASVRAGDHRGAAQRLEAACAAGDAVACSERGELHARGLGGPPDLPSAARFYRRACELGDGKGCVALADALLWGRGVPRDPAAAVAKLEHACDDDEAAACVDLGRAVEHGAADPPDPAGAFDAYRRAAELYRPRCEAGEAAACTGLGTLLREGSGVPEDREAGLALQQRACKGGHAPACIAWMSRGAHLVATGADLPVAEVLLSACRAGDGASCFVLLRMGKAALGLAGKKLDDDFAARGCAAGHGGACNALGLRSFPPDAAASAALERACALGDAPGCHHLALSLELSSDDLARAAELHDRSCRWRWAPACLRAGTLAASGETAALDPLRAAGAFRIGCDLGSAASCYELGILRLEGTGVTPDPAAGRELVERACRGGEQRACARLARSLLRGAERDPPRARAMLEHACDEGHGRACLERIALGGADDAALLARARQSALPRCERALAVCRDGTRVAPPLGWSRWAGAPARVMVAAPACGAALEQGCAEALDALALSCRRHDAGCLDAASLAQRLQRTGLGPERAEVAELERRGAGEAKKRCEAGEAFACAHLAEAYRTGSGVPKDAARATAHRARACELDASRCR